MAAGAAAEGAGSAATAVALGRSVGGSTASSIDRGPFLGSRGGRRGGGVPRRSRHRTRWVTGESTTAPRSISPICACSSAGRNRLPEPAEDVVDDRLGDRDLLVAGEARRLEPDVGELVDQVAQRHAVLEGEADRGREGVHQARHGRALLGHLQEDLAGLAVGIQADGDVALVAGDVELVGDRLSARPGGDGGAASSPPPAPPRAVPVARRRAPASAPSSEVFLPGAERLAPLGAVAVDGDRLEPELPALEVDLLDLLGRWRPRAC